MTTPDAARTKAVKKLRIAHKAVVRRLAAYRLANPSANVLDDRQFYPDGSYKGSAQNKDGLNRPNQRIWKIGSIFDLTIYICQEGDSKAFQGFEEPNRVDFGAYKLAVSVIDEVMDQNTGLLIKAQDFDQLDWSIERIMAVIELLNTFAHKADMARRIKEFRVASERTYVSRAV